MRRLFRPRSSICPSSLLLLPPPHFPPPSTPTRRLINPIRLHLTPRPLKAHTQRRRRRHSRTPASHIERRRDSRKRADRQTLCYWADSDFLYRFCDCGAGGLGARATAARGGGGDDWGGGVGDGGQGRECAGGDGVVVSFSWWFGEGEGEGAVVGREGD